MQNTTQGRKELSTPAPIQIYLFECRGSRLTKCFQGVSPTGHINSGGEEEMLEKDILILFLTKLFYNAQFYHHIRKNIYSEGKIDRKLELELEELG